MAENIYIYVNSNQSPRLNTRILLHIKNLSLHNPKLHFDICYPGYIWSYYKNLLPLQYLQPGLIYAQRKLLINTALVGHMVCVTLD